MSARRITPHHGRIMAASDFGMMRRSFRWSQLPAASCRIRNPKTGTGVQRKSKRGCIFVLRLVQIAIEKMMRRDAAAPENRLLTRENVPPHHAAVIRRMMRRDGAAYRGRMGEIQRHHVTHHLNPELQRAVIKAAEALAQLAIPLDIPAPEPEPAGPHVEWWTFHDPRQACEVGAFLDPQNQVRHVPVNRTPDVPRTWRRIYLGDPH